MLRASGVVEVRRELGVTMDRVGGRRCRYYVVWAVMAVMACCSRSVAGFNVDVTTASLRHGEADSMFGFSVAQHVDHDQTWSV